jgi:hypothetical protein
MRGPPASGPRLATAGRAIGSSHNCSAMAHSIGECRQCGVSASRHHRRRVISGCPRVPLQGVRRQFRPASEALAGNLSPEPSDGVRPDPTHFGSRGVECHRADPLCAERRCRFALRMQEVGWKASDTESGAILIGREERGPHPVASRKLDHHLWHVVGDDAPHVLAFGQSAPFKEVSSTRSGAVSGAPAMVPKSSRSEQSSTSGLSIRQADASPPPCGPSAYLSHTRQVQEGSCI